MRNCLVSVSTWRTSVAINDLRNTREEVRRGKRTKVSTKYIYTPKIGINFFHKMK